MNHIHFIAIGGAVMHNLAIALHKKGYKVTGSDDEIFEPSKSRLLKHGILPKYSGWRPDVINKDTHAVILGMHAYADNPELIKAQDLNIKIYSFPEYLYEQTKDKKRVVIGGSHGKTTTTSMILHVLQKTGIQFDYMVGAQIEGFDTMVGLSDAPIAIFEGDEYLSSKLDLRPKFHLYKPHIAVLTGIEWDHVNVFPSFENYVEQFELYIDKIEPDGTLIYCSEDKNIQKITKSQKTGIHYIPYKALNAIVENGKTILMDDENFYPIEVFGGHNLQNMSAAKEVCLQLGISKTDFLAAISSFKGANKRLQLLAENLSTSVFLDFAHSPSKLKATTQAVKKQFNDRQLIACMELHTYSSLKKDFLPQYSLTMSEADMALIYFNPETIKNKRLEDIKPEQVKEAFGGSNIHIFTDAQKMIDKLKSMDWKQKNLLLMSSGNFSGIDFKNFAKEIINI